MCGGKCTKVQIEIQDNLSRTDHTCGVCRAIARLHATQPAARVFKRVVESDGGELSQFGTRGKSSPPLCFFPLHLRGVTSSVGAEPYAENMFQAHLRARFEPSACRNKTFHGGFNK